MTRARILHPVERFAWCDPWSLALHQHDRSLPGYVACPRCHPTVYAEYHARHRRADP